MTYKPFETKRFEHPTALDSNSLWKLVQHYSKITEDLIAELERERARSTHLEEVLMGIKADKAICGGCKCEGGK